MTRAFLNSAERQQSTNTGTTTGTAGNTAFFANGQLRAFAHRTRRSSTASTTTYSVGSRTPGVPRSGSNILHRGFSFNDVTRAFLNSSESQQLSTFTGQAGNLTSDQLNTISNAFGTGSQFGLTGNDVANVMSLYQTILNRNPTQTEVNNQLNTLSQGTSLGVVRNQLMNSSESQQFLNGLGVNARSPTTPRRPRPSLRASTRPSTSSRPT